MRRVLRPSYAMLVRLLLCTAVVATSACARDLQGVPTRPPDIEGLVTEVRTLEDGSLRILVEEVSDFNFETAAVVEGGKKAYVRVTDRTELKDGVYQPSTRERIRVHERARARAWFTGAVTKSYPAQAEAEVFIFWILAP